MTAGVSARSACAIAFATVLVAGASALRAQDLVYSAAAQTNDRYVTLR